MMTRWQRISRALALAALIGSACVQTSPDMVSTVPDAANDTGVTSDVLIGCNADPTICPPGSRCNVSDGRCVTIEVDAGPVTPRCVPGISNDCRGENGCNGTQRCGSDGTFGACGCPIVSDAGSADTAPPAPDVPLATDVVPVDAGPPACSSGLVRCPSETGSCVDPVLAFNGDTNNCGRCGNVCPVPVNGRAMCVVGRCDTVCNVGFAACDSDVSNGCETDVRANDLHCGRCGNVCAADRMCVAGACVPRCPASGTAYCDGRCVSTQTDASNCGSCGTRCQVRTNATTMCSSGACAMDCNVGFGACDTNEANGCETDLRTNDLHCGHCGHRCESDEFCSAGACVNRCSVGQNFCGGRCIDTASDRTNCGACGHVCDPGTICVLGACTSACAAGNRTCGTTCTDLSMDTRNCGTCGNVCPSGNASPICSRNVCSFTCNTLFGDCDRDASNGCEQNLRWDTANCGACGRACADRANASEWCDYGSCGYSCNAGFGDCMGGADDGCETNLNSDVNNCGGCRRVCPVPTGGSATCTAGLCGQACPTGQTVCGGRCVNTAFAFLADNANCGRCGNVCPTGNVCRLGVCTSPCPTGQNLCVDGCRTLSNDVNNCGACGVACSTGPNMSTACSTGACSYTCSTGYGDCDGNPRNGCEVDVLTNGAHCGACGRACSSGQTCLRGVCTSCAAGLTDCAGTCRDTRSDPVNCGGCGLRCAPGQVCSGSACFFTDAGVDATSDVMTDATADVTTDTVTDGGDAGTDVVDATDSGDTSVVDAAGDTGTIFPFILFVAPPSGTAAVSTSDSTNTVSLETANRSTLVGHSWIAGGAEATPFALPGMSMRVGMTAGFAIYKLSVGGVYQDMCRDCVVHGRCDASRLGYRDGDFRIANQPYASSVGENADGRIIPVNRIMLRVDPYRNDGTCALIFPIDQPLDSLPPGTRLP